MKSQAKEKNNRGKNDIESNAGQHAISVNSGTLASANTRLPECADYIEKMQKKISELEADNIALREQNDEIRNKLSFFESAIEKMPNPVFIKDCDGRFVFFNECYAESFGMSKEKNLGGTVLDLDYLPEKDRYRYQQEELNLIADGGIRSYDMDFLFTDGKIHTSYYWSKGFACQDTGERGLVGEIVDISDERENRDNLEKLVRSTAYMFDFFYVLDLKNRNFINIRKGDEVGRSTEIASPIQSFYEEIKTRFYSPVNGNPLEWCFTDDGVMSLLSDKNDYYFECRDMVTNDAIYGITMFCIEREHNKPVRVAYAARDITAAKKLENDYRRKLKKANEKLKDLAYHDELTGLYNRRGLLEAIDVQLNEDSKVAMLLIDVDHFKTVNDSFGHQSGDMLLVKVAELLQSYFRTSDILARLGGDEFMVIILDCDYEHGDFISQKIENLNRRLLELEDNIPKGSVSVGVTFSRTGEKHELYDRADAALYRVKQKGRCGCCIYEDEFKDECDRQI